MINGDILDDLCHPIEHGYYLDMDGELLPIITGPIIPDDYPTPCTYGKCAQSKKCPCRVMGVKCTDFCKCKRDCRNPNKWLLVIVMLCWKDKKLTTLHMLHLINLFP